MLYYVPRLSKTREIKSEDDQRLSLRVLYPRDSGNFGVFWVMKLRILSIYSLIFYYLMSDYERVSFDPRL